jgi:hypothetical protein
MSSASEDSPVKYLTKIAVCIVMFGVCVSAHGEQRVIMLYSDSTKHTMRTIAGLEWSMKNKKMK